MSFELKIKPPLPFGYVDEDIVEHRTVVRLFDFCYDPDGSGLLWFKSTGGETNLDGLTLLDTKTKEYHGQCYDTGEFYSHAGELLDELMGEAPEKATLAVFQLGEAVGTKTFTDFVTVEFYGKNPEEAKESTDG